jgi:hypothetical protein
MDIAEAKWRPEVLAWLRGLPTTATANARPAPRSEPALRELGAWALVNKGVTLGAWNRSEDEIKVYDEVVRRFGEASEPAVLEQVARALINKSVALEALNLRRFAKLTH